MSRGPRATAVVALVLGAGCSSPSSHSTDTAIPASARAHLGDGAAPLLDFERVTAPLARGARPARAVCATVQQRVAGMLRDPAPAARALKAMPDRGLAEQFRQDVANKTFLLSACTSATGLVDSPDEQREFRRIASVDRRLLQALQQIGLTLDRGSE